MRLSKAGSQRVHAKRRFLQRYGLALNRNDLRDIGKMIRAGKGIMIRRQSLRVTIWEVSVAGIPVRVVYDKNRKNIVTALPRKEGKHS